MKDNPKISVIMPVYNGEKYISQAIESVLNQTFKDFELIIINDGSADRSEEIIKSYSDPRIVYLNNDGNKGLAYTRNRGIEVSRGEYFAWLDCDDIALPERLQTQFDFMEANLDYGLCCTNMSYINMEGEIVQDLVYEINKVPKEWLLIWGNPIAQSSVMIRREVVDKHNFKYDPKYNGTEDYIFWCNLALVSKIHRIEDVLVHYRLHTQGVFQSNKIPLLKIALEISKDYVKSITSETPPLFFQHLTIFPEMIGKPFEVFNLVEMHNWLNQLKDIASKRWGWNRSVVEKIELDIQNRLYFYYSKISRRQRVQNLFQLIVNLKFKLFFKIVSITIKGYIHTFKKLFVPLKKVVIKSLNVLGLLTSILLIKTIFKTSKLKFEKQELKGNLKILIVPYAHENVSQNLKGGDDTVNGQIKNLLEQAGHSVEIFIYNQNYSNISWILKKIIGIPYLYAKQVNDIAGNYDIIIADGGINYNIKHPRCINLYHYSFLGYSTLAGINWDILWRLKYRKLSAIQEQGAKNAYNISVSEFQKEWLEKENVKVSKVIYNSINTDTFKPLKTKKEDDYLFLGGYSYYGKGFDVLERLASKKGLRIDCITNFSKEGDGLNYKHTVPHSKVPEAMNSYKIFIYPTRYDSCSMSVLEAMSCGLPTITGNVGIGPVLKDAIPEFVVDGYDDKAVDEYYDKIRRIEENYEEFSKKAREYIMKNHSYEEFKNKWLEVINYISN